MQGGSFVTLRFGDARDCDIAQRVLAQEAEAYLTRDHVRRASKTVMEIAVPRGFAPRRLALTMMLPYICDISTHGYSIAIRTVERQSSLQERLVHRGSILVPDAGPVPEDPEEQLKAAEELARYRDSAPPRSDAPEPSAAGTPSGSTEAYVKGLMGHLNDAEDDDPPVPLHIEANEQEVTPQHGPRTLPELAEYFGAADPRPFRSGNYLFPEDYHQLSRAAMDALHDSAKGELLGDSLCFSPDAAQQALRELYLQDLKDVA